MKKGVFSKILIASILIYLAFIGVWAMQIFSITGLEPIGTVGIIFGFFGTELVLLLLKKLFVDTVRKDGGNNNDN